MTHESAQMAQEKHIELNVGGNTVELIGTYGSDVTHSLSAWTSTERELTPEKRGRISKLLKTLGEEGHHTPFEKSALHFLINTDVCSHIHLIKHRIGVSVNAESARYKELKGNKLFMPQDWDDEEREIYVAHMEKTYALYHETLKRLVAKGFSRKRAKESARFYLPYGNQITSDVMFNFRSFYHFLMLRYSNHAQVEIRDIALKMLQLINEVGLFPHTLRAFGLVGDDGAIRLPH